MRYIEPAQTEGIEPIFVSVKEAAKALGISPWSCYQLLDAKAIESKYLGRRRLVSVASLRQYATSLNDYPTPA
jgi:excisionase family DNA binding protein